MSPLRSVLIFPFVAVSLAVTGCGADLSKPVRADVLDVKAANMVTFDIDGQSRKTRLAGIVVPGPGECMGAESLGDLESILGDGKDLMVHLVGVDSHGVDLVTVKDAHHRDVATQMVADGMAVADALDGNLSPQMSKARDAAVELGVGLLDDSEPCTFATQYAGAMNAMDEAPEASSGTTSSAVAPVVAGLVAAVAAGEAAQRFAIEASRDLRLLAYPAAKAAVMTADLRTNLLRARTDLGRARALETRLVRKERRERARKREVARRAAEQRAAEQRAAALAAARAAAEARQHSSAPFHTYSHSSSGSSSSGGSHSGYTGPRCYEPGGKVWHPC